MVQARLSLLVYTAVSHKCGHAQHQPQAWPPHEQTQSPQRRPHAVRRQVGRRQQLTSITLVSWESEMASVFDDGLEKVCKTGRIQWFLAFWVVLQVRWRPKDLKSQAFILAGAQPRLALYTTATPLGHRALSLEFRLYAFLVESVLIFVPAGTPSLR
eukprot:COSAG02_NODE_13683_length_1362_cov_6.283368_1_plen_157_part_00